MPQARACKPRLPQAQTSKVGAPTSTFQLEDQRDQLESDISVHGLTCPSATASYVHANPAKYGTTTEGMCCHSTLELQLGQLKGLVYAQKFHLSGHLAQLESDILQHGLTSASATAAHVILNPL
jgi:hypothetical protein